MVNVKLPNFAQIGFRHDNPKVFAQSQWQSGDTSVKFLVFRWLLAVFYIGITLYSMIDMSLAGTMGFWFIYMTHWGIFISMIATTFGAILTTLYHRETIKIEPHSLSYKLYWFLSNVSTVFAFVITVVYWIVLFEGKKRENYFPLNFKFSVFAAGETSALDVLIHGGNSVGMLLELCIARYPIHIFHFLQTIGAGTVYVLFTVFYFLAGGLDPVGRHYIYHVLDWKRPGTALINAVGIYVLGIFLHILVFVVQKLRHRLYKKFFQKESLVINSANDPKSPV